MKHLTRAMLVVSALALAACSQNERFDNDVALGGRRANAAREYLITQGVSPARLRTVTYGKERPIEICSVESCYAKNRRAVTVLAAGAIS
jgi:outer membrane protein OmpA-like peptidoglycan-associated protein